MDLSQGRWLIAALAATLTASVPRVSVAAEARMIIASVSFARAPQGSYRGVVEDQINVFRGIAYADPPVGDWRWRPPRERSTSQDVQDATKFGAICPQGISEGYRGFLSGRKQSEDCLTLNVWSSARSAGERRPVMVFLHPGSFLSGSGSFDAFDGRSLARGGVVLVTLNYRLGVFGFFAHPALTREATPEEPLASFALMDQIAALRWVQRNIAAFGGDPANVTIFGMSAGGQSVNYLMATPAARGLFHRAISESSAVFMFKPYRLQEPSGTKSSYEAIGSQLAGSFKIGDAADTPRRLRSLSTQDLLAYQAKHMVGAVYAFEPVIDGRLLRRGLGETFARGEEAPVPYVAGATDWEGSLVSGRNIANAEPMLQVLSMSRSEAHRLHGDIADPMLVERLQTDSFLGSQRWLVRRHAQNGHAAWLYFFSYVLEAHRKEFPGAPHGAEARYVFGTLDGLARVQDRPMGTRISPADRAMAATVAGYWIGVARRGDPNGEGRPAWPTYLPAQDVTLELGAEIQARPDLLGERMRFMEARFDAGDL